MDNPSQSPNWRVLSQAEHREGITLCQHLFDIVFEWSRKPLLMVLSFNSVPATALSTEHFRCY